ncbi:MULTISPECIES: serine hydrolase [unclassified Streptomyces]|uniref:serine hydrolase n=1 Tax=Streptomyces sp. NPDC127532 TaxID=3345399 RepID=UPI00362E0E05
MDLDAELAGVVAPLIGDARLSVAVLDTGSGTGAVYGDGAAYDTASIVKVDILAALLLRAQDEGRGLSDAERTYAAAMIGRSDNASATRLWRVIGGAEGLDAANVRLGLTGTAAARAWGLTQTTAADQVRLLRAVFDGDGDSESAQGTAGVSVLSRASRAYVRRLMGRVEADQQWGVSAAGDAWALKNGWMPRTTTGLWDINSIGRVRAGGRDCLMAVLCDGQPTKEAGITLVEAVAKAAVGVVSGAR